MYHSTLGLRVITKKKKDLSREGLDKMRLVSDQDAEMLVLDLLKELRDKVVGNDGHLDFRVQRSESRVWGSSMSPDLYQQHGVGY